MPKPSFSSNPPPDPALTEAAGAFEVDWNRRQAALESSPIMAFLEKHEIAGSPNELIITGVADVKVTLGDLRAFVRALK